MKQRAVQDGPQGLSPGRARYDPEAQIDPSRKEWWMKNATADHDQRLHTMAQVAGIVRDRLDVVEGKLMTIDPKTEAT